MADTTYAKVGGPPADWDKLQIRDLDSGELIDAVVEVDTRAGWCVITTRVGQFLHETRRFGRFAIERQPEAR